jgi:Ca2+-binding RTX toxin-like protein
MIKRHIPRLVIVTLIALILISSVSAFAATNTVPTTRIGQQIDTVSANALKPAQCAALNLTTIVVCTGGNCNGTGASELLLGTANGERIRGRGGFDCIVGGGGNDDLVGNGSNGDVCIGGPGADTFATCETQIQ